MSNRKLFLQSAPAEADIAGWMLRGGIGLFLLIMGMEKFPSGPSSAWVPVFERIGIGQWFRYATGVIEMLAGALFFFPRTNLVDAALLARTMLGAMFVHIVVRGSIGASLLPALVLVVVAGIAFRERERALATRARTELNVESR